MYPQRHARLRLHTQALGLSDTLGAFLAGILLAETKCATDAGIELPSPNRGQPPSPCMHAHHQCEIED